VDIFLEVFSDLATRILTVVALGNHSSPYVANIQNKESKVQNFQLVSGKKD
jgi:hypothetical protein